MWFLILALLFWGYLLVKLGSERLKIKGNKTRCVKSEKEADEFFEKYSVSDYEWERLTHWFEIENQNTKHKYYVSVEAIKTELSTIIGVEPTYNMIYWGVLAKQGKIPPKSEISFGYNNPLSFKSVHDFDYCFYDYTPEERNWFFLDYLKWYDKTISENGMEYKLVYARVIHQTSGGNSFLSDEVGDIEAISHDIDPFLIVAYWKPLRAKVEKECH